MSPHAKQEDFMDAGDIRKAAEWGANVAPVGSSAYQHFIKSKQRRLSPMGFEPIGELNPKAFDWQREIITWAIRRGRAALFEDCGLGKTFQQLIWAEQVVKHTGGNVVIHCPVGVRWQTRQEAERFGIGVPVDVVNHRSEITPRSISLINYEKMHLFDGCRWEGVVLDESSILKSFTGKIKRQLCDTYKATPYRLPCTATPAPNDHMELGNHAEFLGVCDRNDMLNRFFVHDSGETQKWRLRKHAVEDFWSWVSSWAVCIETPSDIGYSDDGYVLPALNEVTHCIECDITPQNGFLFDAGKISATGIHSEKRKTSAARAAAAADLINGNSDLWVVWCDTNYEADDLASRVNDCVEVRGSDSSDAKESKLRAFSNGDVRVIITKPTIAGFGMNWQHCHNVCFVGLSYSYEQYYQALRRLLRFGQLCVVNSHIITTVGEEAVAAAVRRKRHDHDVMKHSMASAMRSFTAKEFGKDNPKVAYSASTRIEVPQWLNA